MQNEVLINCKEHFFNGQYFSEMLSLPEYLHESLIWDAAHRLEFVHDDVKCGKMAKRIDMATLLQLLLPGFRSLIQIYSL